MKSFYIFISLVLSFLLLSAAHVRAQSPAPTKLFRFYEDNDFLNVTGHGTDRAYTNGTRLDFFYQRKRQRHFFLDKLLPKAGDGSVDVYGWSVAQLMVTPNNISTPEYQPGDYAYAGALIAMRSYYSFNPTKKFSYQTELVAGVRGPAALGQQAQTAMHKLIHYQKPMGWDNQLDTQPLLNVNFTAEKNLVSWGNFFEINAGAQVRVGSMMDALALYPMLRIGRMAPYFNGYLSQYSAFMRGHKQVKTQYYFVFKPVNTFVVHNALLKGDREHYPLSPNGRVDNSSERIAHRVMDLQFGVVLSHGNFSVSYLQTYSTTYRKGLYRHTVGTLTLHFLW